MLMIHILLNHIPNVMEERDGKISRVHLYMYMCTNYFHENSTCRLGCVQKKKLGMLKIRLFMRHVLSFLHRL
jgi:hypothetical protein